MKQVKNNAMHNFEEMKAFACLYCVKQEQYSKFIKSKLKKKFNASNKEIGEIVNWLKSIKVLDDNRFAHAFVNDKIFLNKWGINKVIAALRYRGIPDEIIMNAIRNIDQKKYLDITKHVFDDIVKNENDKATVLKKMAYRGFQNKTILQFFE